MWRGSTNVRLSPARRPKTMAEIINLKRAKKAKARRAEDAKAMDNRVRFGTPKAEKSRVKNLREKDTKTIDAHRLDDENG
jgi:hypothetical protein